MKKVSKSLFVAILLLGGGTFQSVQAQSLNCGKVESDLESAICNTPELTRMDIEAAVLYRTLETAAETAPVFKEELQKEQREWLHSRREECGGQVSCLEKLYKSRIADLQELARKKLQVSQ